MRRARQGNVLINSVGGGGSDKSASRLLSHSAFLRAEFPGRKWTFVDSQEGGQVSQVHEHKVLILLLVGGQEITSNIYPAMIDDLRGTEHSAHWGLSHFQL